MLNSAFVSLWSAKDYDYHRMPASSVTCRDALFAPSQEDSDECRLCLSEAGWSRRSVLQAGGFHRCMREQEVVTLAVGSCTSHAWCCAGPSPLQHRQRVASQRQALAEDKLGLKAEPQPDAFDRAPLPNMESFGWDLALGWTLQWGSIACLIFVCFILGQEALLRAGAL